MQRQTVRGARSGWLCSALVLALPAVLGIGSARAEQPPSPCHPNPTAATDEAAVRAPWRCYQSPQPPTGSARPASQPAAHLSAAAGVRRGRWRKPIVSLLPTGYNGFRTQRLYHDISGGKRPRAADRHGSQLRLAHGWRSARGAGAQAWATDRSEQPAPSTMSSPTFRPCS